MHDALRDFTAEERESVAFTVIPISNHERPRANYPGFLDVPKAGGPRVFLAESRTQMRQALRRLPPLARSKAAEEAYEGRWVRWHATVKAVREGDECFCVDIDIDGYLGTILTYPRSWRDDVEALREGDRIWFEAQVRHVDEYSIDLVHPAITQHLRPEQ